MMEQGVLTETRRGYCRCGCGEKTNLAPKTSQRFGWTQGEPLLYLLGHANRKSVRWIEQDCGYHTPCHVWQLGTDSAGYGYVSMKDTMRKAHRAAWEERHGAIPEDLQVDHLCRTRACVNPDHLELVTHTENVRRGSSCKLTDEEVEAIRHWRGPRRDIAARFGITPGYVSELRVGRTRKTSTKGP